MEEDVDNNKDEAYKSNKKQVKKSKDLSSTQNKLEDFGRRKGTIAKPIEELDKVVKEADIEEVQRQEGLKVKRSAEVQFNFGFGQVQSCVGSRCLQTNNGDFGQVQLCGGGWCDQRNNGGFGQTQLCGGALCNQDNFQRFPFGR